MKPSQLPRLRPLLISHLARAERVLGARPPVHEDLRQWANQRESTITEIWRDHPPVRRALPHPVEGEVDSFFVKHQENPVFARYLVELRDAEIRTRSGMLIVEDGGASSEHFHHFLSCVTDAPDYYRRWRRRPRRLEGLVYSLIALCPGAHYHWMTDILQRLYLVLALLPPSVRFLIPHNVTPVQLDALEAFGIGRARLERCAEREDILCSRLLWSPPATWSGFDLPEALDWTAETLLAWFRDHPAPSSPRIYVSRKAAVTRRIENEDGLRRELESHGFVTVQLEGVTLAEQIALFRQAQCVIAPHGAGLVNLMFATPGTRVLELFPGTIPHGGTCYWSIAHGRRLEYYYLKGESLGVDPDNCDYRVPIEKVRNWLSSTLLPETLHS